MLGEIGAFFTGDRIQQIGLLVAGVATWFSHYAWDQKNKKRKANDDDKTSRRVNRLLDALTQRFEASIKEEKPFPFPELIPYLLKRDDHDHAGDDK